MVISPTDEREENENMAMKRTDKEIREHVKDQDEWDNRLCGRITKAGKRCRAHAQMEFGGRIIGCHLHDPRRRPNGPPGRQKITAQNRYRN
jgi:hypothetical protein